MSTRDRKDKTNNRNTIKYLDKHLEKSILRFLTCGSVDDGKSTLIGRLLFETKAVFSDQFAQLKLDSKKFGTQGNSIDYALLLDGLSAEQERGTISMLLIAFFQRKNSYSSLGHEQQYGNWVHADAAVILIDARKDVYIKTSYYFWNKHIVVMMDGPRQI